MAVTASGSMGASRIASCRAPRRSRLRPASVRSWGRRDSCSRRAVHQRPAEGLLAGTDSREPVEQSAGFVLRHVAEAVPSTVQRARPPGVQRNSCRRIHAPRGSSPASDVNCVVGRPFRELGPRVRWWPNAVALYRQLCHWRGSRATWSTAITTTRAGSTMKYTAYGNLRRSARRTPRSAVTIWCASGLSEMNCTVARTAPTNSSPGPVFLSSYHCLASTKSRAAARR